VEVVGGAGLCLSCEAVLAGGALRGDTPSAAVLEQLRVVTLGEFILQRELGRGRLTIAFLAHDVELGRDVVIKVVRPEHARHRALLDRFWRAASRSANLVAHPNVVRVFRAPERKGLHFLVVQHVDGCSLEQLLRTTEERGTPLSVGAARHLIAQLTAALRFAHDHGVVHGDVEPGNVLIDRQGTAVVTDFGIAEFANRYAVGTAPWCASPEQWRGVVPTPASDQYALGALAYRLLAGAPPFAGSVAERRRAHLDETPPSLRRARPDCPEKLVTLVDRMLATHPDARWPNLAAVHETLARLSLPDDAEDPAAEIRALVSLAAPAAPASAPPPPSATVTQPTITQPMERPTLHDPASDAWMGVGALDRRSTTDTGSHPAESPAHPAFDTVTVEQVRVVASRVPRRGGWRPLGVAALVAVGVVGVVLMARARFAREAEAEQREAAAVVAAVGATAPASVAAPVVAPPPAAIIGSGPRPVPPAVVPPRTRSERGGDVVAGGRERSTRRGARAHTAPSAPSRSSKANKANKSSKPSKPSASRAKPVPRPVRPTRPTRPAETPRAAAPAPTVASTDVTIATRSAVDGLVDAVASGRSAAVARRIVTSDAAGRAFVAWVRDARALEVSPVVIERPVSVTPDSAVSVVRVWVHWRAPSHGRSRRRDAEARFRLPLTREAGVWRPGLLEVAGPLPGR
jgi:serine/threonine-protein kinase